MSRRAGTGLAIGAAGLASLATLVSRAAARRISHPSPVDKRYMTPWELALPHEEVSFRTTDGLLLRGWWMPREGARRTVVALAGHNGGKHHCLGIGSYLWRRGANVLLFDNRGRGESEGTVTTLGALESLDAHAAVGYALSRAPELPLGLVGYSMGGAVAVMVAARDGRVGAVVADSAFASQRELLKSHIRRRTFGLPAYPLAALIESFLPHDVSEVEPVREVSRIAPRSCLFVHGLLDEVTDPNDSRSLYEAAGEPKELWLLQGVGHCGAYFADRAAYCERVAAFLERYL